MITTRSRGHAAGILLGLASSASFGTIPLFSIPLMRAGISVPTVLAYRFTIATIVMGGFLLFQREKLFPGFTPLLKLIFLSTMYLMAVELFYEAFRILPSGVTATIQFLYPVMVMLIMICFFHEPFRWPVALATLLAFCGVAALSWGPGFGAENGLSSHALHGVLLALLAGLANGLYFIGLQVARLPNISGQTITFYIMLFGSIFCVAHAIFNNSLQWISQPEELGLAVLLALITAVFSNLTLVMSIKRIGSTLASILGVLEPVTAVVIGTLVFHEPFTFLLAIGVLLVSAAVAVVVLNPAKKS